ncbi:MAG: Asp-tRNA(Asn)/Glu-tRNA(Gln) amidotransferase subunit GatB [Candidatus Magasanikbacteria bacterium]|nr:Asp-tRNA(Asn)/Glu-tRNA(Gln) amidotransferase subunit GatB [Candidatus Magasanikbacteria bacterium]
MELIPIIGLEVHVELATKSKMFCACPNNSEGIPANTNICPVCLAHPGSLPVPNRTALGWAVLVGRALDCTIREVSKFDRKHYFYPDLPKGYQISQFDEPIAEHGSITLTFPLEANIRDTATISIRRAHMEEDTAKSLHDATGATLIDFNRAGAPLVEIVTGPDFKSALEAKTYAQELQRILRYLGVSQADMEKGQMRVEANVSVQPAGSFEIVSGEVKALNGFTLNHKIEVKNINSFKAVEKAILFEIERQTAMIAAGEVWGQATRGWDENKGETVAQRSKENAADYRYFPEPDIPPFHPALYAGGLRLPELPMAKRARLREELNFSYSDAEILTDNPALANFAEAVVSEVDAWLEAITDEPNKEEQGVRLAKLTGGWITGKLLGLLNASNKTIKDFKTSPENFAELLVLMNTGKLNSTNALKILEAMVASEVDIDPTHVMEEKGYGQVSDEGALQAIVAEVIKSYPAQVEQYRAGKIAILQFLKGMVMKTSEGSADPAVAEKLLVEELSK